jgi:hypothetical protein
VAIDRHVERIHVTRLEFVCRASHGPHVAWSAWSASVETTTRRGSVEHRSR